MKVKIGGQWYDAEKTPIMIKVDEQDKNLVRNMADNADRLAWFPDDFGTVQEMRDWMNDGYLDGKVNSAT